MPRLLILLNPHAGSADAVKPLVDWSRARGHELVRTESARDARERAGRAAAAGRPLVAAGGDGTLHEVVAGALSGGAERPRVGLVPLGTGNDMARSLGIPARLPEALEVLDAGHVERQDVVEVTHEGARRWCVNVATGGFGGELAERVTDELKARLGPLAYLWGGITLSAELEPFAVELELDGRRVEADGVLNVIVANGRYAAGGFDLTPAAALDDGLLDVLLVPHDEDLVTQVQQGAQLLFGSCADVPGVRAFQAAEVTLRAEPPLALNLDGEPLGRGALQARVVPGALDMIRPPRVRGVSEPKGA